MDVHLKGNHEIHLDEVERDDDQAVIGATRSGKRFVTRRDRIAEPLPDRHPYRIYTTDGRVLRVVDPAFEVTENWFLGDHEDDIAIRLDDGQHSVAYRAEVLSILSATPEDEREAEAGATMIEAGV